MSQLPLICGRIPLTTVHYIFSHYRLLQMISQAQVGTNCSCNFCALSLPFIDQQHLGRLQSAPPERQLRAHRRRLHAVQLQCKQLRAVSSPAHVPPSHGVYQSVATMIYITLSCDFQARLLSGSAQTVPGRAILRWRPEAWADDERHRL